MRSRTKPLPRQLKFSIFASSSFRKRSQSNSWALDTIWRYEVKWPLMCCRPSDVLRKKWADVLAKTWTELHAHTIKQSLSFVEQIVANSKVVRNTNTTRTGNYNVFLLVSTCMLVDDFKNLLAIALDEAFVRYVASVGRYDNFCN